ncbi:hypothetical protein FKV42_03320 [Methanolobus vulcani]|uniref:Probable pectate lyase C n=2 Tax=Methanolobus vulcani TaxID=38026 RepID=A0A7Z8P2X6_9EURY|nr:hypothetical protein FKV42_03320 [Methanolobus vulcani]
MAGSINSWGVSLYADEIGASISNTLFSNNFRGISIDEDNVRMINCEVYNSSDKGITIAYGQPVNNLWMENVESHLSPYGNAINVKYWSTGGLRNSTLVDVTAHHANGSLIHLASARNVSLIRVKTYDSGWYDEEAEWQNGAGVPPASKPINNEGVHSGLDLHTEVQNIYVEDFEAWHVENALYVHNTGKDVTVNNASVHDSFGGFNVQAGNNNVTLNNCEAYNIGFGSYYDGAGFNIHSSKNITISNSEVFGTNHGIRLIPYDWGDSRYGDNVENITLINNHFHDQLSLSYISFVLVQPTVYFDNIEIIDQQEAEYELRHLVYVTPLHPINVLVKYTSGKVFEINNMWSSISSDGSLLSITLSEHSLVTSYDLFVKPTSYDVDVIVKEFDTSKPIGNNLVEFIASSTEGNNVDFTIGDLQPYATYMVKMDGYDFSEVVADEEGLISFSNDIWSEHTFTLIQTSESSIPISSSTSLSFTPSATSLTATSGESTTFSVDTSQEFTSAVWSFDDEEVESGTTEHVEAWATAGTHTVTFEGTAAAGTISRSWTVVVSAAAESEYSSISISPSTTTVVPGESFSLDVYIDPTQAITGSQFDLQYSQLASISTVNEGDLFSASGLSTTFQYDSIDNAAGFLDNVYAAIVGSGSITSPDVMATIGMVAGSSSGILDIELANVILSDANSNPAEYNVSNATILIDTAPQFTSLSSQTVEEEQSLSFTAIATDADSDDLTYTATSLPSGATFNDGSFSWTPSEGAAGSYVASFEVTDGYLTDTVNVSITVTSMNHIPEITLFEPADGSIFEEGSTIDVNVAVTDVDGDSLSYIIEIDGVEVSTSASYSWTTDYESAGTHTIKVTVSDGTDDVSSSGTITITDLQPRWDVNEDGTVNVLDITLVGQNYGKTYTEALPRWDVNQDGTVNIQDLSIVSGHFGEII